MRGAGVIFEVLRSDLGGRIGTLRTRHGEVRTPAYVPVVHPVRQLIPASQLRAMGFEMVITNAYITMRAHGEEAARRGIHDIIGFDGAVMTDSGGYQVLEYGAVDVRPPEMAAYERSIGSDVAVPLDTPTGARLPRRTAAGHVRRTLEASRDALSAADLDGQIWAGPVQGGEHLDMVAGSARRLARMGYEMLALGSPVEFMESYDYSMIARMIVAARRGAPAGSPLHLFGAGHPLTVAFSVALGCDTFDSASYALYAKHDRYMTADGTRRLRDMSYFSCACEVCARRTPAELAAESDGERLRLVSLHNLHAIASEVGRVREAISEGRLWEYTIKKLRAHPRLYEVLGVIVSDAERLASLTPLFKDRAAFFFGPEDSHRPEVARFHAMVRQFRTKKRALCLVREPDAGPAYAAPGIAGLEARLGDGVQICLLSEFLGIVPLEISDVYPAAHHVAAAGAQADGAVLAETWSRFVANNAFDEIFLDRRDALAARLARSLPRGVRRRSLPPIK